MDILFSALANVQTLLRSDAQTMWPGSSLASQLVAAVLLIVQIIVLFGLCYYYLLLVASIFPSRPTGASPLGLRSFAIVIPAHNEETVLAETLRWLRQQDYPAQLFDIYVVADYCDDNTAGVARAGGAICYERCEGPRGRKAYALRWLLQQIIASGKHHDAFVVFDADSRVDPGFLRAMNRSLDQDHLVLQGKHVILTSEGNRFGGLAAVDMRLNNLLRNQAKRNLGLSCRLMGDAMCFAAPVILEHGWPTESMCEDREFGLYLLTQGIRTSCVPEAISYGQAAPNWRAASGQRLRWYRGARQIQQRLAFRLLMLGLRKGDWAALDGAVELLLPPYSVLALLSVLVAMVQVVWPSLPFPLPLPVPLGLALLWVVFPFAGLIADRAPRPAYRALLYGPFYLLWRISVGLWARVKGDRVRWVRTPRREEVSSVTKTRA